MIKYTQLEMGQHLWHEESTLTKLYQSSFTQSSRNTLYNSVQGGNSLKSQPRGQIKHLQQAPAQTAPWLFSFKLSRCLRAPKTFYWISNGVSQVLLSDLKFVKKFTRPNFRAKEFYTLKTRKSRLFLPAINSKNASLSAIWPSFG